jgi:serine protease inhibitor
MAPTSMPAEPDVEATIDRSFIFLIRDIETGTVLFPGQPSTDPTLTHMPYGG